jgi:cytochrome c-type biogenesis protein CcmH/NrfG
MVRMVSVVLVASLAACAYRAVEAPVRQDLGAAEARQYFRDGEQFRAAHDNAQALAAYERAAALDPGNAVIHDRIGAVLYEMGRIQEAQLAFERAVELDPHDDQAVDHLAKVLFETGQHGRAAELFERALQANPDSASLQEFHRQAIEQIESR